MITFTLREKLCCTLPKKQLDSSELDGSVTAHSGLLVMRRGCVELMFIPDLQTKLLTARVRVLQPSRFEEVQMRVCFTCFTKSYPVKSANCKSLVER